MLVRFQFRTKKIDHETRKVRKNNNDMSWRATPRCSFGDPNSFPSSINPALPGNPCYLTFLPPQAGRATNPRKKINRMLCYYVRTALTVGGPSE